MGKNSRLAVNLYFMLGGRRRLVGGDGEGNWGGLQCSDADAFLAPALNLARAITSPLLMTLIPLSNLCHEADCGRLPLHPPHARLISSSPPPPTKQYPSSSFTSLLLFQTCFPPKQRSRILGSIFSIFNTLGAQSPNRFIC